MVEREFVIHMKTDGGRHVVEAAVYRAVDTALVAMIGSEEFGPFDDTLEFHSWLWRVIRRWIEAHPTE